MFRQSFSTHQLPERSTETQRSLPRPATSPAPPKRFAVSCPIRRVAAGILQSASSVLARYSWDSRGRSDARTPGEDRSPVRLSIIIVAFNARRGSRPVPGLAARGASGDRARHHGRRQRVDRRRPRRNPGPVARDTGHRARPQSRLRCRKQRRHSRDAGRSAVALEQRHDRQARRRRRARRTPPV